jgi:hypothetical protein
MRKRGKKNENNDILSAAFRGWNAYAGAEQAVSVVPQSVFYISHGAGLGSNTAEIKGL